MSQKSTSGALSCHALARARMHTWPRMGTVPWTEASSGVWFLKHAAYGQVTCGVLMACITQWFKRWDAYSCSFKCNFRSALGRAMRVECRSCLAIWPRACRPICSAVPSFHGSTGRRPRAPSFFSPPPTPNLGLAPPAVECIRPQNGSSAAAVAHGEKPDRLSSCWAETGQGHSQNEIRR